MGRREDILARLRTALQLSDPEWDAAPGTPEYKILEAVAQELDSVTYDSVLSDYGLDINKKSGLELDAFVGMFGFTRVRPRRATGVVTFSRGVAADVNYAIPVGTQVAVPATAVSPAIFFQTVAAVVLEAGTSQVDAPVEAVVAGTSGNAGAGQVRNIATVLSGITAVANNGAMSGGVDGESDQELRDRWRTTVFRNLSGTEDQFLALAFNEPEARQATVVGASERFTEQLQVPTADPGSGWTSRTTGTTQGLRAVARSDADGLFVAVGDAGTVISSSDGATWTSRTSGTIEQLLDVTYHSSPDVFVATGYNTLLYSQNGTSWTSSATGANTYLRNSAYDGSIFVVVGDSGTILTSTFSTGSFGTWSAAASPVSQNLNGVTYSSSDDLFVAVGDGGTIVSSANGTDWTKETSATASDLRDVEYSSVLDMFVAVGTNGTVLTSSDGKTWAAGTTNAAADLSYVVWAAASNTFVAAASNGNVLVSQDGTTWGQYATGSAAALYGTAFSASLSLYIAVGGGGTAYTASNPRAVASYTMRSQVPDSKYTFPAGSEFLSRYAGTSSEEMAYPDTDYEYTPATAAPFQPTVKITTAGADKFPPEAVLDFQHEYTPLASRNDPAAGVVDKVDVFVGGERAANVTEELVLRKTDAFTFGAQGALAGTTTAQIEGNAFQDFASPATASSSPATVTNPNGWTRQTSGITTALNGVAVNSAGNRAVAVGASGATRTSTNLTSWSSVSGLTGTWNGVDYHSTTNFLASGPTGQIAYGTGTSWTVVQTSASGTLRSSAYGSSTYVVVGDGGAITKSSSLGSGWASVSSGTSQNLAAVTFAASKFVAVGASGTILTSSNGSSWSLLSSVTSRDLRAITYSPELDLFVAVGALNTVLTSPDGSAWTVRTPPGAVANLLAVAWSSTNNAFVATTDTKRVYTSRDGATWALEAVSLDEAAVALVHNSTLGTFLAVGAGGYIATAADPAAASSSAATTDREILTSGNTGEIRNTVQFAPGASTVRVDFYAYRNGTGTASNGAPTLTLTAYNDTDSASVTSTTASLAIGAWTARSSLTGRVNAVAFGRGYYVAVGAGGRIWTATSYIGPWTLRSSGTTNDLYGVTYGKDANGVGVFVAVGASGTILTSTAPTATWTTRTSSGTTLYAVANGGGTFVAVGASGAVRYISTTPSAATTWTTATAGSANLYGVAYSSGITTWVAVGASGAMYSSTSPATWTSRTSGFSTTDVNAVATDGAATNSTWVLVGNSGKVGVTTTIGTTPTVATPLSGSGNPNLYTVAAGPSSWFVGGANGSGLAGSPAGTWASVSTGVSTGSAIRASIRGADGWIAMGDGGAYSTAVPSTTSSKVGSLTFAASADKLYTFRVKWTSGTGYKPILDKVVVTYSDPTKQSVVGGSFGVRLTDFLRDDGFSRPRAGNYYMRLFKAPVASLPDELVVGGQTYTKNVDFWLVRDDTLLRGSTRASEGIEWSASTSPGDGVLVTVPYAYNSLVERIHEQVNLVRLVGTDVLVHEGRRMRTRLNLAVVARRGFSFDSVSSQLGEVMTDWLASKGFRGNIQVSDLYDRAYAVPGVDNVRLVRGSEARNAIQTVTLDDADAGQFRLTFLGATTTDIAYDALPAAVSSALEALPTVGSGNVSVTGAAGGPWRIAFVGGLGQRPLPLVVASIGTTPHNGVFTVAEAQSGVGHGIQFIAENGVGILSTHTSDVYLRSDEIPVFHSLTVMPRAQNTF